MAIITSIEDWRKHISQVVKKEEIKENVEIPQYLEIVKFVDYLISLNLSKDETIKLVSDIFTDPSKAPENISVQFVKDNVQEILNDLEAKSEEEFKGYSVPENILSNNNAYECVMYVENNEKIKKLADVLNIQIKKEGFKSIYENNIFFINSLDMLNEKNKNTVLSLLKENNAININESIKWKRILS